MEIGDEPEATAEDEEKADYAEEGSKEAVTSDRRLGPGEGKAEFKEMVPVGGATLDVLVNLVGHTNR